MTSCFHCGDPCDEEIISQLEKNFCCFGCKTVYDILNDNDLGYYYELEKSPGTSPKLTEAKFDFLDNPAIAKKLLEFDEGGTQVVSFLIPSIHCSSCIWVLENLNKLHAAVLTSQVNFPEKTVRITFSSEILNLKQLVLSLAKLGYEPYISLDDAQPKKRNHNKTLIYKLGVAGFAFGNVMFLSFPEYFEETEFWLDQFKHLFRWLMFAFSLPVVFYSGQDYFISAYKGLRSKILNIDVPIALGISVLFMRSTIDIILDTGSGFFDSLTGLVFFLLLGKFFQQKTYAYLSFERDYKSYFPMAVTQLFRKTTGAYSEAQTEVHLIKKGDRLLIRNNELIPVDAILLKGDALIDYSFVTGEAVPVSKLSGDKVYAGGKQQGGVLEIEVLKPVSQSYLTQLWSNEIFSKTKTSGFQTITDGISKQFTVAIVSIAFLATLFWLSYDPSKAFNVFTAVLIVACPCAIALAAPFTLGNVLRLFGNKKWYVKEASVIEQIAKVDTLVFDKTGTLTSTHQNSIIYEGVQLSEEEKKLLSTSLRNSNHPLSRSLYKDLKRNNSHTLDDYEEVVGKGIFAKTAQNHIKIGSYNFVTEIVSELEIPNNKQQTAIHISTNDSYKGCYIFNNEYRNGIEDTMQRLAQKYKLIVLSGDNDGELEHLSQLMPQGTEFYFNQKPAHKLHFIKKLQENGKTVLMMGDGLNDAGALKQSDVGIAISEDTNVFTPACDGILDASVFTSIPNFLEASKRGVQIIKWSFLFSLCYNLIGLAFAVTGHLKPVVAAILMPLSSISIVVFTTLMVRWYAGKSINNE
ncbi:heavy metal translocating P-type ATPase [Rasiella sp. SM2506]|uniref:heavy metal translocating P-type ATPase n=1 Tax=Rasiella sp. SM2506 TaxID=3423914 RepID=UPI003D7ACD67